MFVDSDCNGSMAKAASLQDNPYKVLSRRKALLWQVGIVPETNSNYKSGGGGKLNGDENGNGDGGALIVSGLNLMTSYFKPGSVSTHMPGEL
jgi:hypothetical protein